MIVEYILKFERIVKKRRVKKISELYQNRKSLKKNNRSLIETFIIDIN